MKQGHWRPLALGLALLLAIYAVAYRFMPNELKTYALFPFGALSLFAGARLNWKYSWALPLAVLVGTDAILYSSQAYPPNYGGYLCYTLYVFLGLGLLRKTNHPGAVLGTTGLGYTLFFLITNAMSWYEVALEQYRERTFQTLMLAYYEGLAFLKDYPALFIGEIVLSLGVFALHGYLAKKYVPSESVATQGITR